jgi:hypothetical protein
MIRVLSVVDPTRVYPYRKHWKRSVLPAAVAVLALAVFGCGGGGKTETAAATGQTVSGPGFSFRAPGGWAPKVLPTSASAGKDASTLVSVTVLPLVKPYRPALFLRVAKELDRVAAEYASSLKGTVTSRRTVTVAGRKAREYRIEHADLVDRITFLLRGRRNFQLTCRWLKADGEPAACAELASSFAFR